MTYSEEAVRVTEAYVIKWLSESKLGQSVLAQHKDLHFDEAVNAIYELLNRGFLQIVGDHEGLTGIETRFPPRPPLVPIRRAH